MEHGRQNRENLNKVLAKAAADSKYYDELKKDPIKILKKEGVFIRDDVKDIKILKNSKETAHIVVPDLEQVSGGSCTGQCVHCIFHSK